MLNDKQLKTELKGLTAGDAVICLQIIQRLVNLGQGAIQDSELTAVGSARTNLVKAMEDATGVNFDVARAAQARAVREAQQKQAAAQAAAAQAQAESAANEPAPPPPPVVEVQDEEEPQQG